MMRTLKRILRSLGILLMLLSIAGGLYYTHALEVRERRAMDELYAAVAPLQEQREELLTQREELEAEQADSLQDLPTVELLFRELPEALFSQAYPALREQGFVGVLALGRSEYPGGTGRLSRQQLSRLTMDGWTIILQYESGQDFNFWLQSMKNRFKDDGLELPRSIYFPGDTYDPDLDETLRENGFDTVIFNAGEDRQGADGQPGELWHVPAMPWNYTGMTRDLDLLAETRGGNLCFTVSFNNIWDAYEAKSFASTLAALARRAAVSEEQPEPLLQVCGFAQARDAHLGRESQAAAWEKDKERRIRELDEQIRVLDEQIDAFYAGGWTAAAP